MRLLFCFLVWILAGCASQNTDNLYERLGGEQGIITIVDNLLYVIAEDPIIRPLFEKTDLDRFHEKLSEQLCEVAGGPCIYTGDDMVEVHAGMAMNNRHFDAMVTALDQAMQDAGVTFSARNAMLARLAALHEQVMQETVIPN
ncbi:group I truncated hemoglobin [Simiduia agarivorans]|uniref:Cyanoglobin, Hemoglobin-like protein HbN n=1 Tax=Simiduia agarivorans (strain DSM 21679 / JCM 13881 / BCRC 17597 / SA1) TaxID=1117647 RepID=K4KLD3_SIMAS|nr:group 1 truncated hemoglobin [Simiduia agarivorans]AFU99826.1 Cyanoglobin, Hemoglobin-like protein HbN [Simiduia agarivorans SA1 = DSM 21679]